MKKKNHLSTFAALTTLLFATTAEAKEQSNAEKKACFHAVTKKLDPAGELYTFYNAEKLLGNFPKAMRDFVELIEKHSGKSRFNLDDVERFMSLIGVQDIDGLGFSYVANDYGTYTKKSYLYRSNNKADGLIWKLFGKDNVNLQDQVRQLPANTVYANFSTLNISSLYSTLKSFMVSHKDPKVKMNLDMVEMSVKAMTGKEVNDILASLANKLTVIITTDPNEKIELGHTVRGLKSDAVDGAVVLEVKDSTIFDLLVKLIPPTKVKLVDDAGTKYLKLLKVKTGGRVQPVIVQDGNRLILASNKTIYDSMKATGGNAKLATSLSKTVPANGISFEYISPEVNKGMETLVKTLPGKKEVTDIVSGLLNIPTSFSVTETGPNGYFTTTNTTHDTNDWLISSTVFPAAFISAFVTDRKLSRSKLSSAKLKSSKSELVESEHKLADSLFNVAVAAAKMNFGKGAHKVKGHTKIIDGKTLMKYMPASLSSTRWKVAAKGIYADYTSGRFEIRITSIETDSKKAELELIKPTIK